MKFYDGKHGERMKEQEPELLDMLKAIDAKLAQAELNEDERKKLLNEKQLLSSVATSSSSNAKTGVRRVRFHQSNAKLMAARKRYASGFGASTIPDVRRILTKRS